METDTNKESGPKAVYDHITGEMSRRQRSIIRSGGMAGLLTAFCFILAAAVLLGGSIYDDPKEMVDNFPQYKAYMAVGDVLYLVTVLALFVLVISLYHTLRRQKPLLSLVGAGIGSIGLAALAVGSLPYVAYSEISDLYQDPAISPDEQASLVHLWQAVHGIFNEIDTVGFMLLAVGFIMLSLAMRSSPDFAHKAGCAGVILGIIMLFGMSIFTMDSDSIFPFVLLAFIVLPVLYGSNLLLMSRRMGPEVVG